MSVGLCLRLRIPHDPWSFVFAAALPAISKAIAGPGALFTRCSVIRVPSHGHNGISQVPRRPFPHLCRALRPRLNRSPWPYRISRCCPRSQHDEGFSAYMISRLTHGFGTSCLRFTSDVAATRARLASGWRAPLLPGGRRTLWVAVKGFRLHPSSFPGLTLTQAGRMSGAASSISPGKAMHPLPRRRCCALPRSTGSKTPSGAGEPKNNAPCAESNPRRIAKRSNASSIEKQLDRVSAKAPIAQAIRYALKHWQGLTRFLNDGRIDLDSNIVERSMRPQALTRKNALRRPRRRRGKLDHRRFADRDL
jgi:hypothetical protein